MDVTGTYFEFNKANANAATSQTRAAVIAGIQNAVPRGEFQDPVRSTSGLTRIEVAAARNINPVASSEWFDTSTISTFGGRSREEVRAEARQYVQNSAR